MNIKHIAYRMLLYDLFYFIADRLIKHYNPCEIQRCEEAERGIICVGYGPCCGRCRYLGNTGCTTKCLKCKLFLCTVAAHNHPKLDVFLRRIVAVTYPHGLLGLRSSRQQIYLHLRRRR